MKIILDVLLGIVKFIVMITMIVGIHELGHLITAKMFGVYCFEYSLGMGPKLFQKKNKETWFSIRAIPIGGFVSMAGEPDANQEMIKERGLEDLPYERTINGIAKWKQIIVMLAGVTMNFLLALIIFSCLLLSNGEYTSKHYPDITGIKEESIAEKIGLQVGDEIEKIKFSDDNLTVKVKKDVDTAFAYMVGRSSKPYELTIKRNNEILTFDIDTSDEPLGIELGHYDVAKITLLNCIPYGFDYMVYVIKQTGFSLLNLFAGKGFDTMGGAVAMYDTVNKTVDLFDYFITIAIISVSVAVLNLLPVPAMDGGRALMTSVEIIIGKEIPTKLKNGLIIVSMGLLLALMVALLGKDIWVYFLKELF